MVIAGGAVVGFQAAFIGSASASENVAITGISNGIGYNTIFFIVPPGWYYLVSTPVTVSGSSNDVLTLTTWTEWV